jgi:hypothetical protein
MLLNSLQEISYLGIKLYNQKSIIETPQETIDNIVMQNEQFKPTWPDYLIDTLSIHTDRLLF